jgi:hypothetical protein
MASIRVADPMLPALGRDFDSLPADAAGAITSFTLAYGLMQLVWGPLGDRLGKLRLIDGTTLRERPTPALPDGAVSAGRFHAAYYDHHFPLSPESYGALLREEGADLDLPAFAGNAEDVAFQPHGLP